MSSQGITLIMRATLVIFLIIVMAVFRTLVGPGRRRGRIMLGGTLGGASFGVLAAYLMSPWLKIDVSALAACVGMVLGWGASWRFARLVPREAN